MTAKVFNLVQTICVVFALIAAVEYFKYSTRLNYDWFHCTPIVSNIEDSTIMKVVAVGGPSCDKRGKTKTITKKISRIFEPNEEDVIFCLTETREDIIGYGANAKDEEELSKVCKNIIHWNLI